MDVFIAVSLLGGQLRNRGSISGRCKSVENSCGFRPAFSPVGNMDCFLGGKATAA
jgi:hypothetical protein